MRRSLLARLLLEQLDRLGRIVWAAWIIAYVLTAMIFRRGRANYPGRTMHSYLCPHCLFATTRRRVIDRHMREAHGA